jgi:hypothetical protein
MPAHLLHDLNGRAYGIVGRVTTWLDEPVRAGRFIMSGFILSLHAGLPMDGRRRRERQIR